MCVTFQKTINVLNRVIHIGIWISIWNDMLISFALFTFKISLKWWRERKSLTGNVVLICWKNIWNWLLKDIVGHIHADEEDLCPCLFFSAKSIVFLFDRFLPVARESAGSPFFSCACTSSISCCSCETPSFHKNKILSGPLSLLQENRQFGSKMTDSKYFTTTKKGLINHSLLIRKINKTSVTS